MSLPKNLQELFDLASPTKPASKKSQTESGSQPAVQSGFTPSDRSFLKECFSAVHASLQPMQQSIPRHDEELKRLKETNEALTKTVDELKKTVGSGLDPTAELRLDKMQGQLDKLLAAGNDTSSQASTMADPMEFNMCYLEYDTPKEELESRARSVLTECNIPQDSYIDLFAFFEFGSKVTIVFASEFAAMQSKHAVRRAGKKFPGTRGNVFIDKRAPPEVQVRKAKLQKAHELLTDWYVEKQEAATAVIKCNGSRTIYYRARNQVLGQLDRGGLWNWGVHGNAVLPADRKTKWEAEIQQAGAKRK